MDYTSNDIYIFLITLFLLISINYFRKAVFRYYLIIVFLLFSIFVYYTIDKRYSLGILIVFILNYMFIARKPILEEGFKGHKEEEKEEPLENPQLEAIEEDVETQEEENKEEDKADLEEELGIDQFKTEDKFTKLHDLLHTLSEQVKKAEK